MGQIKKKGNRITVEMSLEEIISQSIQIELPDLVITENLGRIISRCALGMISSKAPHLPHTVNEFSGIAVGGEGKVEITLYTGGKNGTT